MTDTELIRCLQICGDREKGCVGCYYERRRFKRCYDLIKQNAAARLLSLKEAEIMEGLRDGKSPV